jgi:hypothetical protein
LQRGHLSLETVEPTLGGSVGAVGSHGVVGGRGVVGADRVDNLCGVEAFGLPGIIVFLRGCGQSAKV